MLYQLTVPAAIELSGVIHLLLVVIPLRALARGPGGRGRIPRRCPGPRGWAPTACHARGSVRRSRGAVAVARSDAILCVRVHVQPWPQAECVCRMFPAARVRRSRRAPANGWGGRTSWWSQATDAWLGRGWGAGVTPPPRGRIARRARGEEEEATKARRRSRRGKEGKPTTRSCSKVHGGQGGDKSPLSMPRVCVSIRIAPAQRKRRGCRGAVSSPGAWCCVILNLKPSSLTPCVDLQLRCTGKGRWRSPRRSRNSSSWVGGARLAWYSPDQAPHAGGEAWRGPGPCAQQQLVSGR